MNKSDINHIYLYFKDYKLPLGDFYINFYLQNKLKNGVINYEEDNYWNSNTFNLFWR